MSSTSGEQKFKAKGIQKAKQSFALLSMSDEELRAYNRYQDSLRDEASYVETNYLCAKMEGREEGHAEGKEEGKEETTRTIAMYGISAL